MIEKGEADCDENGNVTLRQAIIAQSEMSQTQQHDMVDENIEESSLIHQWYLEPLVWLFWFDIFLYVML